MAPLCGPLFWGALVLGGLSGVLRSKCASGRADICTMAPPPNDIDTVATAAAGAAVIATTKTLWQSRCEREGTLVFRRLPCGPTLWRAWAGRLVVGASIGSAARVVGGRLRQAFRVSA